MAGGINLYGYVGGDPVNWVDPWGLLSGDVTKFILVDTATPDPSDVAWVKWAVYGAIVGGAIIIDSLPDGECEEECKKITLYRGVNGSHPMIDHARVGWAIPLGWTSGGHNDPAEHNFGDTNSIFTSWSIHQDVADFRADMFLPERGVVLVKVFCQGEPRLQESPDLADEGEVLVVGPVKADDVIFR